MDHSRSTTNRSDSVAEDEWLTTREAAEQTGLHRETIRRWIRSGTLEARRVDGPGRRQEVRRRDVLALAESDIRQRPNAERSQILLPGDRTVIVDN